jgi:hypothetical protein
MSGEDFSVSLFADVGDTMDDTTLGWLFLGFLLGGATKRRRFDGFIASFSLSVPRT